MVTEGLAMYRIHNSARWGTERQSGTTLIVALVLILLATLLSLFAMNVGIFEQRTSGNDVRSRLVQQTTEAALAQGMEYFRANSAQVDKDATLNGKALWAKCAFDDDSFPCGTVATFAADGTTPRRSTMYYFIGGTQDVNNDGNTNDNLDIRSVPLDRRINTTSTVTTAAVGNNFQVNYGVGGLLCMVQTPVAATDPTKCTTDPSKKSGTNVLTLTAVGSIAGESANTTLTQSIAQHPLLNNPTGKPPVVASGNVTSKGTLQIATNPNAAGPGVPVSIWSRLAADFATTGTPDTCYLDEFLHNPQGGASPSYATNSDGSQSSVPVCARCTCPSDGSLTSTQGNTTSAGIDLLDGADHVPGGNFAIKPGEFPPDLFAYIFGQQAWYDHNNATDATCSSTSYFCEDRLMVSYTANGVNVPSGGADEAYLYANATQIIPADGVCPSSDQRITTAQCLASVGSLNSSSVGLIWDQGGSGTTSGQVVGSPDKPVLLVDDHTSRMQGTLFGLLFIRSVNTPLDPTTGGDATLDANANGTVYGSVVIQGTAEKLNGTMAIVYNEQVLANLGKEVQFNPFGPVPASWTDRFSY
jgi:Tfp pilus assembly protein PilX